MGEAAADRVGTEMDSLPTRVGGSQRHCLAALRPDLQTARLSRSYHQRAFHPDRGILRDREHRLFRPFDANSIRDDPWNATGQRERIAQCIARQADFIAIVCGEAAAEWEGCRLARAHPGDIPAHVAYR